MLEGVDNIIAVIFGQPTLIQESDAPEVWAKLFEGSMPDAYNRNTSGPFPISNARGRWGDAMVQVTSQVGRIDLQWSAPPRDETGRPQQFQDVEVWVERVCSSLKLLTGSLRPARLAIVVNTSSKVPECDPAVVLSDLLGKVYFPPNGSDLMYRLNLQRELSLAPGVKLNRLSTWQSGAHQLITFDPTVTTPAVVESVNFIAHNVDVNTLGLLDFELHPVDDIIDEMQREAVAILRNGLSFYG